MADEERTQLLMPTFRLEVADQAIPAEGIGVWDCRHSLTESSPVLKINLAAEKFDELPIIAADDPVRFFAGYRSAGERLIFTGAIDRAAKSRQPNFIAAGARPLAAVKIKNSWRSVAPAEIVQYLAETAGVTIAGLDLPSRSSRHFVADNKPADEILNKIAQLWKIDYTWTIDPNGQLWWVPEGNELVQEAIAQFVYAENIVQFQPGEGVDHSLTVPLYPYLTAGDLLDLDHPLLSGRLRAYAVRHRHDNLESRTEITCREQ